MSGAWLDKVGAVRRCGGRSRQILPALRASRNHRLTLTERHKDGDSRICCANRAKRLAPSRKSQNYT